MKVYGGESGDYGWSVVQTEDGGYVVGGSTNSFGAGSDDFYVVKTDSLGNIEWEATYGTSYREKAYSIRQTSDLGFIIAGTRQPIPTGHRDIYLVKTEQFGLFQWDAILGYSGDYHEDCNSVQQTSDDGYILAGSTDSVLVGLGQDIYLIKTDSFGNAVWDARLGGESSDWGSSVTQTADGGYFVTGTTDSFGVGEYDYYVAKIDSVGNLEWDATFGGSEYDRCHEGIQTSDGGFVVAGYSNSFNPSYDDAYVVKLDCLGVLEWDLVIGADLEDQAFSIDQTVDEGYIVAGITWPLSAGHPDGYLIKLDDTGNIEWETLCGGDGNEYLRSVQQTTDGGYITTGITGSYGPAGYNVWLVKLSQEVGIAEETLSLIASESLTASFSPNPFTTSLIISYNLPETGQVELSVYDLSGRLVERLDSSQMENGEYQHIWNPGSLESGCYLVRLQAGDEIQTENCIYLR